MRSFSLTLGFALLAMPFGGIASPEQDLLEFREYYEQRFPNTPFHDFVNGVYSIDPKSRA